MADYEGNEGGKFISRLILLGQVAFVFGFLFFFFYSVIQVTKKTAIRNISQGSPSYQEEQHHADLPESPENVIASRRRSAFQEFEFYFKVLFWIVPLTFVAVGIIAIYKVLIKESAQSSRQMSENLQRKAAEHRQVVKKHFKSERDNRRAQVDWDS